MRKSESQQKPTRRRSAWTPPTVTYVGTVADVVRFPCGGKLSIVAKDSGDVQKKPKGQE